MLLNERKKKRIKKRAVIIQIFLLKEALKQLDIITNYFVKKILLYSIMCVKCRPIDICLLADC